MIFKTRAFNPAVNICLINSFHGEDAQTMQIHRPDRPGESSSKEKRRTSGNLKPPISPTSILPRFEHLQMDLGAPAHPRAQKSQFSG